MSPSDGEDEEAPPTRPALAEPLGVNVVSQSLQVQDEGVVPVALGDDRHGPLDPDGANQTPTVAKPHAHEREVEVGYGL